MGKHYEQLITEERAVIMKMKEQNYSTRKISLTLHRAPSTVTRELTRFSALMDRPASSVNTPGTNDARDSGLSARRARLKCGNRSKLATDTVLFGVARHFLSGVWSPSQVELADATAASALEGSAASF